MEDIHRNHKENAWGWVAVMMALLDGYPRRRRPRSPSRRQPSVGSAASCS
jgi:hypothetical protein